MSLYAHDGSIYDSQQLEKVFFLIFGCNLFFDILGSFFDYNLKINLQYGDVDIGESASSNKIQDNHPVTTRRHTVGPGNGLMTQVTNCFYYLIYESKLPLFYNVYVSMY